MAQNKNQVYNSHLLLLILFLSLNLSTQYLPSSQYQTLLQIPQLLNFPSSLSFFNTSTDFCNIEPTSSLTVQCYQDNLTQLHIIGNNGFPSLPQNFSSEAFFSTLVALPDLKVLSLVSLGLWGPLPSSISLLSSLEILNLSSNYLSGSIPWEVSSLKNLQTLVLDYNKFSGEVPDGLGSLQLLAFLSLKNNSLSGSLPNSISTIRNLRVLLLSNNQFSGEVPNFVNLTNLQVLDLQDNYFGPHFPTLSNKLVTLLLRNNKFRFRKLDELGFFYRLEKIDISLNKLVGPFSPSFLSLPSIKYLDISDNKLTGMLFKNMSCNSELGFVNLSSNLLTGELPSCLKWSSDKKVVSYGGNCLSNEDQEQHPSYFCHNEALAVRIEPRRKEEHQRSYAKPIVSVCIVGGTAGGIVIVAIAFFVLRGEHGRDAFKEPRTRYITENVSVANTAKMLSDAKHISQTMKLGASLPPYRAFSLEELKEATNNFDPSTLMGESSLRQIYKGKLADGSVVAIRSLKMRKRHSPQAYTHHIELISKIRHSHLVSALGHCFECHPNDSTVAKIFLLFEYVPNGTMRSNISGLPGQKFSWTQRIAAAIEVVKGIQFLHTGIVPGVYSNNLKIRHVLLDQSLHVKLSTYNLPLLTECKGTGAMGAGVSSLGSKGIRQGSVKHDDKNDVYDIGVILLELILGRPIMFRNEVGFLKDLVEVSVATDDQARRSIIDPAIQKECTDSSVKTMMEICVRCLSNEPADRPSVDDILWNLQFAAQVQDSERRDSQNSPESPRLSLLTQS